MLVNFNPNIHAEYTDGTLRPIVAFNNQGQALTVAPDGQLIRPNRLDGFSAVITTSTITNN